MAARLEASHLEAAMASLPRSPSMENTKGVKVRCLATHKAPYLALFSLSWWSSTFAGSVLRDEGWSVSCGHRKSRFGHGSTSLGPGGKCTLWCTPSCEKPHISVHFPEVLYVDVPMVTQVGCGTKRLAVIYHKRRAHLSSSSYDTKAVPSGHTNYKHKPCFD